MEYDWSFQCHDKCLNVLWTTRFLTEQKWFLIKTNKQQEKECLSTNMINLVNTKPKCFVTVWRPHGAQKKGPIWFPSYKKTLFHHYITSLRISGKGLIQRTQLRKHCTCHMHNARFFPPPKFSFRQKKDFSKNKFSTRNFFQQRNPTVAAKGCSPLQELEKADRRAAFFLYPSKIKTAGSQNYLATSILTKHPTGNRNYRLQQYNCQHLSRLSLSVKSWGLLNWRMKIII